ncbi:MAG: polysaccharide ABC transporter ATP-binding protein [Fulvivirga sp.]
MWYLLTAPLRNFKRLIQLKKFKEDDTEGINWALKDVSFQVFRGEVLGIIGHNGAGKSTLLKVLSRITEPTDGEIHIHGRVSSLLEVGTGFHPELSGRENVYMNGTILGMTRKEIDRKFDDIVEFSGIGKYLDTPVKFYSSGMKVRLAFSVAAHLDPEILIIDEVLAVGDAEFQKKCLGKMNEVASSGRTVLFVSHDMGAVKQLCSRCLAVGNGQIVFNGQTDKTVTHYLQNSANAAKYENNNGDNKIAYIKEVEVLTSEENYLHVFGRPLSIQIKIRTNDTLIDPAVSFQVVNSRGVAVLHILNLNRENEFCDKPGEYHLICEIPKSRLYPDNYFLRVNFNMGRGYGSVSPLIDICGFEVVKDSVRELYWSKEAAIFIEDTNWKIIRNYD